MLHLRKIVWNTKNLTRLLMIAVALSICTWTGLPGYCDTVFFKSVLSSSVPYIDHVFNSGKASISISGDIRTVLRTVFAFDMMRPYTIIQIYSPGFNFNEKRQSYYYSEIYGAGDNDLNGYNGRIDYFRMYSAESDHPGEDSGTDSSTAPVEAGESEWDTESDGSNVTVNNEALCNFDLKRLLNDSLSLDVSQKGPKVLIYHTHTTESYLRNIDDLGKKGVSLWTDDPKYNVVRVGQELARNLSKLYGIESVHNGTIHDYDFNNAYNNSLNTVDSILQSYPSICLVLDIHRDAWGNGNKMRVATDINGNKTAKVMFVVGTDKTGLNHPQWPENLKLALKMQNQLNKVSEELTRPVYLSIYRYNQHISRGALIIEIGGDGNTLEEALESTKYIAGAVNSVLKKAKP